MRTLNEIVALYLTSVNRTSDDSDLDKRLVKSWIRTSRAIWVKNELNKGVAVSPLFIQPLGILDLEVVDQSEYIPLGFNILRTVKVIPNMIEIRGESVVTRIGPGVLTNASYRFIAVERVPYIGSGRFDRNAIFGFLNPVDKRIYLVTRGTSLVHLSMRKMSLSTILEDPEDAAEFTFANGTPCYTNATMYPITEYLVGYMKDIIVNVDFKLFSAAHPDEYNDAKDEYKISASGMPKSGQTSGNNQQNEEE